MSASGESLTTMHRLLHASGSHPIPPPNDPRTNQYNQDLGLIHSPNGNHLESPNEGSSIDHQAKTFPTFKILSEKTVNTYVATNKTIDSRGESEETHVDKVAIVKRKSVSKKKSADEEPVEVVEKAVSKKRSASNGDEPAVTKNKRTTKKKLALSKASMELVSVAQDVEPISVVPAERPHKRTAPKRKLRLSAGSDDEIVAKEPATAEMETEEMFVETDAGKSDGTTEATGTDVVLGKADIVELDQEPTRIKFSNGISIPGVADGDLYKESLPKIALADKGKAPLVREQVIYEVSAFFNSFSLRRLPVLTSLTDITVKEEKVLTWAETDSVQIGLQRRFYIVAKYRELLLRKFLESHRAYFSFGQPWSAMALQIIDLLSIAHNAAVNELRMQKQAHMLQWTRPCCSMLFEVKDLKAELSKDFDDKLDVIRNDLLEFRVETQGQLASLGTNLSELIAFVTKGRDDKKVEVGSSHGRGQPPPGYGGGIGSRSEPSRKRGSNGLRQKSWRYWLNE
ncbi:hypothetical protein F511_16279 [Dorcoceras hygrometricum]|uniref:Uncharacterized protein n=1 Tax=Dorcoceras hygrometricum TaxID=472368 RepID=A0A2Z7B158_9LAMI|nr:hypothetical protein F511_16279 [Dorcoceras hygrometricum]